MIGLIIQLMIIGLWAFMLGIQARRLYRLAQLETLNAWERGWRRKLVRVWWWLGREEYWQGVQNDGLCCMQLTCMLMLMFWGVFA